MDATSAHQDSLPVSSDVLLERLRAEGVDFELHSHPPLHTVDESKEVQAAWLSPAHGGGHIKNLYLRDHRKRNYLVVAEQDRAIDLKALAASVGRISLERVCWAFRSHVAQTAKRRGLKQHEEGERHGMAHSQ